MLGQAGHLGAGLYMPGVGTNGCGVKVWFGVRTLGLGLIGGLQPGGVGSEHMQLGL